MDQWTELADEADRDQAAADAAEGERLRAAIEQASGTGRWLWTMDEVCLALGIDQGELVEDEA